MSEIIPTFACKCKSAKKYKLTLDGGPSGNYILELCSACYNIEDKQFVIKEELLTSKTNGPEGPYSPNPSSVSLLDEVIDVG